MSIFVGCCGVSGLEKLVLPLGLVGSRIRAGAEDVAAGVIVLPIFASLPLRTELVGPRPSLVCGDDTFLIIVADLERLL